MYADIDRAAKHCRETNQHRDPIPALTDLERKFVENMVTNDYGDAPDHEIWTDCYDCGKHGAFISPSQARGVISSLIKKGIIGCNPGDDGTCWLTERGKAIAS